MDKSESAILARALSLETGNLSPELAEHVLSVGLAEEDKQAARQLVELSKQGELTAEQALELDNYRRAGRIFELLKSKARTVLNENSSEPQ